MDYKIITTMEIKTKEELKNLRKVVELTTMEKPNFSKLGKRLGIDRRTAKKYYYEEEKKERKPRKSELDGYYELIKELLSEESKQLFSYKDHLYRYLQREHNLKCTRNNFNHYILRNYEFAAYFKSKGIKNAVKTETPFGKQAQFDWKEKLYFEFKTGDQIVINVGSLVLSASRFKVWMVYLSVSLDRAER